MRLFSTFISLTWDYILERNNRQCVNKGYPWSSFSVHMVLQRVKSVVSELKNNQPTYHEYRELN